jgi:RimJ/RimL family protein N-acetyltransferase
VFFVRKSEGDRAAALTFQTARLLIRTLRPADQEFLADLDCDPEIMEFVHSGPLPRNEALKYAEAEIGLSQYRRHLGRWIVELREEGTKLGWIELSKFEGEFDEDAEWRGDDINLGFQFGKAYWGQGFASEAAHAVLTHAFGTLHLERVVAYAHEDNFRSARLLERLGFKQHYLRRREDVDRKQCRLFALAAPDWNHGSN